MRKIFKLSFFCLAPFLIKFFVEWVLVSFPLGDPDIVLATLWAPKTGFVLFWVQHFIVKVLLPSVACTTGLVLLLSFVKNFRKLILSGVFLFVIIDVFNEICFEYEVPISEYVALLKSNNTCELTHSPFMQDEFFVPNIVKNPTEKRNLVLIFLESMEKNYGSFIPELTELSKENLSFSFDGVSGLETFATTGTLNSTIAKVTGVPQLELFHASLNPLVPSVYSILKGFGYKNLFIQGTSTKFAYFDLFLKNTGVDYVYDNNNISKEIVKNGSFEYVPDKKIFEYSKKKIMELVEPFSLSIATIETHYPNGFYNEDCVEKPIDESDSARYRAVLSCSSREVAGFVKWLQSQDFYNRTTIVLVGDHLFKGKSLADEGNPVKRRSWYNTFINVASDKKDVETEREFTSFDIAPTIMEGLGFELDRHRMGLGVSLFSNDRKTIVERIGLDSLNKELRPLKNTIEYQSLFFQKQ